MKRLFALFGLLVFLVPSIALAADLRTTEIVTKTEAPTNLYVANRNVTIDANVTGDLVAAGGSVTVNGNVQNSATLAGGTVTLKGNVGQNVRIAGGTVVVDGTVAQDLIIFGGQLTLSSTSVVKGDVIIYGGTVALNGQINGKVVGSGGDVQINGTIGGNVNFKGVGTLSLSDAAVVGGDLTYSSTTTAKIGDSAKVSGKINYTKTVTNTQTKSTGATIFSALFGAVGAFVVLWIVTLLLPKSSRTVVESAFKNPWANVGIGFAVLVVAPVAMILTLITIVGMPVAALAFLAYGALMTIGGIYAGLILGSFAKKTVSKSDKFEINPTVVLIGVLLMALFKLIPVLGWIIVFGFFLLAVGTLWNQALVFVKAQK